MQDFNFLVIKKTSHQFLFIYCVAGTPRINKFEAQCILVVIWFPGGRKLAFTMVMIDDLLEIHGISSLHFKEKPQLVTENDAVSPNAFYKKR